VTSRPDPGSPEQAINTGTASHIRAASPGGPRYDPAMTSEQRRSAKNGIWLCAKCARIIDSSDGEAWPVAQLEWWKRDAERAAARDSEISASDARDLVEAIEAARGALIGFRARREAGDPSGRARWSSEHPLTPEWFRAEMDEYLDYSTKRQAAFDAEVAPLVTDALTRAEQALGPLDPAVLEAKGVAEYAHVNYLGMGELAQKLQALASALELR
jgi:hypothetical protein